jgi:DNA recombination protein RmuC
MDLFIIISVTALLLLLVLLLLKAQKSDPGRMAQAIRDQLQQELKSNRQELSSALRDNRTELAAGLERMAMRLEEKLSHMNETSVKDARANREELSKSMAYFQEAFTNNVKDFNDLQKQKFQDMALRQDEMLKSTELKLEKMRETVDEKLHKTLEDRLGQSFKLVSERLEAVQKGLGEMQSLANGVGDLKKVLSNVKTRGSMGEIQLGNILEQIMAPEQYATNIATKKGSGEVVEFAIKLPGRDDNDATVYLPIDAKFPQEDYLRLQAAFETGEKGVVDIETKKLTQAIKKNARDIRDKYIDPPNTTDFGIMFLPVEGLYAEVVRQPELLMLLQREYKIIVTGPTTLAAMLNSLQMGFKTLAIQKRSSEVWQVLGAVKTEFSKFGQVLAKARKKIGEADKELDSLVGTRTKMMLSKLSKIEKLPAIESPPLLDAPGGAAEEEE